MKYALLAGALLAAGSPAVPQDERAQDSLKPGLCAAYYNISKEMNKFPDLAGEKPTICRIDPQINFEMKDGWGFGDLSFRELFAAVWTGVLRVPLAGKYTFYLKSDDGSKLYLDGKLVIDNDGKHPADEDSKTVDLTAGDHDVKVEYFQNKGKAGCQLSWKYEGIEKQPVPASAFWHAFNKELDTK